MCITDETLVDALRQVIKEQGTKDDLFRILGVERATHDVRISQRLRDLKKAGVAVPDFRQLRRTRKPLTQEVVQGYNEALGGT